MEWNGPLAPSHWVQHKAHIKNHLEGPVNLTHASLKGWSVPIEVGAYWFGLQAAALPTGVLT